MAADWVCWKIWDLFEDGNLFKTAGGPGNRASNVYHLAHMVALLGCPPEDFLQRCGDGLTKTVRFTEVGV